MLGEMQLANIVKRLVDEEDDQCAPRVMASNDCGAETEGVFVATTVGTEDA